MKRVVVLLGGIPLLAAFVALSGCGDGVEPRPPAPPTQTATNTVKVATETPTLAPPSNTPTNTSIPTFTPTEGPTEPPTETPTVTATMATSTPTATMATQTPTDTPMPPTATPTGGLALCGNNKVEGTETCDDGGVCLNGSDHGKRCPASVEGGVDCAAPGVCRPVGGDGCAENCTEEVFVDLKLGDADTSQSMSNVQGGSFAVPLTLTGRLRARAGAPRDEIVTTTAGKQFSPNDIPLVQTVTDNRWTPDTPEQGLPPIPVPPGIACACVRGYAVKSCGALLPDEDGFTDCSPRCLASDGSGQCAGGSNTLNPCSQDSECPGGVCGQPCNPELPEPNLTNQCPEGFSCTARDELCPDAAATCDFIHGPGNQASGKIACDAGYTGPTGEGIDYVITLDSLTSESMRVWSGGPAPAGAALITNSTAIGNITGSDCSEDPSESLNGPDGLPCTDDDLDKSFVNTIPLTTGSAEGRVVNANGQPGAVIVDGSSCGSVPCVTKYAGNPFMCAQFPDPAGGAVAGAFSSEDLQPLGDVGVPSKFVALP